MVLSVELLGMTLVSSPLCGALRYDAGSLVGVWRMSLCGPLCGALEYDAGYLVGVWRMSLSGVLSVELLALTLGP